MFNELLAARQTESGSKLVELFDVIADVIYASCPANAQRELALSYLTNTLVASLSSLLPSGEHTEDNVYIPMDDAVALSPKAPVTYSLNSSVIVTPTTDVRPSRLPKESQQVQQAPKLSAQQPQRQPSPQRSTLRKRMPVAQSIVRPAVSQRIPTVQPTQPTQPTQSTFVNGQPSLVAAPKKVKYYIGSAEQICEACQGTFFSHPEDQNSTKIDGRFLRILCDGNRILC